MGFCKSNQKNMPVVGLLTHNDCDVLRAKTGLYRWFTPRTIIPPTVGKLTNVKWKGVWWAHNGAPSMGKMAVRPVCICGDFCELAQCTWCGLGEAEDSTPHGHSNGAQNTLGDWYGMRMPEWAAWCVDFSGSCSELEVCKKCCRLSKFLPMPVLILLFHNR